jgi:hypothetical protein
MAMAFEVLTKNMDLTPSRQDSADTPRYYYCRLIPYRKEGAGHQGGQWHGKVRIAPDFDNLPADLCDAFGLPAK